MTLNKTGLAIAMSAILFSGSVLAANGIDDGDDNKQWTNSANTATQTTTQTNSSTNDASSADANTNRSYNNNSTNNANDS